MTEFQAEKISDILNGKEEKAVRASVLKISYWAKCYEELDAVSDCTCPKIDGEAYRIKIGCMLNEDGNPKYFYPLSLVLTALLMSHGNADPERDFSVNKNVLKKYGNNLLEDKIESIRTVKDFLIQSGGQNNVKISTEMIKICKDSRAAYQKYLVE